MKKTISIFLLLLFAVLQNSCKQKTFPPSVLSQKEAIERKKILSWIEYTFEIDITSKELFKAKTKIHFNVIKPNELRLDFRNGKEIRLLLNGKTEFLQSKPENSTITYNDFYFLIPKKLLKDGVNTLEISYTHLYNNDGVGLHQFLDPKDNERYVYTQFEPFHMHEVFPCFDQPDLKAKYNLTVDSPKNWKVLSAGIPQKIENKESDRYIFPQTKPFSTYAFAIVAGNYHEWKANYKNIPLGLYTRKSQKEYIVPEFWFQITKQGLVFFEEYFGIAYPFEKYDQILVPEFNFGAMENVGAVTFSERLISRTVLSREQKARLAEVILHELSHMWFGNLATMKWWNGLWLNESFASFLSTLAMAEATEFTEAWQLFFLEDKKSAYFYDQSSITHSIESEILDTEEAFLNFDAITYSKGASILKQLYFLAGKDNFRKALSNFLNHYSFTNAGLKEFLLELTLTAPLPWEKWAKSWLETSGTNTVFPKWECNANVITKFDLIQERSESSPTLREHKTNLQFYQIDSGKLVPTLNYDVLYLGKSTPVLQTLGKKCPDFIDVNNQDFDFVIEKLDPISQSNALIALKSLESFPKTKLLYNLNQNVRNGNVKIPELYALLKNLNETEENPVTKKVILSTITSTNSYSYSRYIEWQNEQTQNQLNTELEKYLQEQVTLQEKDLELQKKYFQALINMTKTQNGLEYLWELLTEKTKINGLKLDIDLQWSILLALKEQQFTLVKIEPIFSNLLKKDTSIQSKVNSLKWEALTADPKTKSKWWEILFHPTNNKEYSLSTLKQVSKVLFPNSQRKLQVPFMKDFYAKLQTIDDSIELDYVESIVQNLTPAFCNEETKSILETKLRDKSIKKESVKRTLQLILDEEKVCVFLKNKHKS